MDVEGGIAGRMDQRLDIEILRRVEVALGCRYATGLWCLHNTHI